MRAEAVRPAREESPVCRAEELGFHSDSSGSHWRVRVRGKHRPIYQDHPLLKEEAGRASLPGKKQGGQVPGKSR